MVDDAMKMQCFLLLCAVISVSLAEDNCTGRAQKDLCGDLCVFNCVCGAYPNNQTLEANVSHKKWCCAEPGTCSLTAKDNGISRSSTATCTTGVIQPLSVPCNGHCNDHRPLIDRGDRTYLMCDSGDQCVGEYDICQGKPLCRDKSDLNWCRNVEDDKWTTNCSPLRQQPKYDHCNGTIKGQCIELVGWGGKEEFVRKCWDRSDDYIIDEYKEADVKEEIQTNLYECPTKDGNLGLLCASTWGSYCQDYNYICGGEKSHGKDCENFIYPKDNTNRPLFCTDYNFWKERPCNNRTRCSSRFSGECFLDGTAACQDYSDQIYPLYQEDGTPFICKKEWYGFAPSLCNKSCKNPDQSCFVKSTTTPATTTGIEYVRPLPPVCDPSLLCRSCENPNYHRCSVDGREVCIAPALVCDSYIQCDDESDEKDCKAEYKEQNVISSDSNFQCTRPFLPTGKFKNNTKSKFWGVRCDGKPTCLDGEDEDGCLALKKLIDWKIIVLAVFLISCLALALEYCRQLCQADFRRHLDRLNSNEIITDFHQALWQNNSDLPSALKHLHDNDKRYQEVVTNDLWKVENSSLPKQKKKDLFEIFFQSELTQHDESNSMTMSCLKTKLPWSLVNVIMDMVNPGIIAKLTPKILNPLLSNRYTILLKKTIKKCLAIALLYLDMIKDSLLLISLIQLIGVKSLLEPESFTQFPTQVILLLAASIFLPILITNITLLFVSPKVIFGYYGPSKTSREWQICQKICILLLGPVTPAMMLNNYEIESAKLKKLHFSGASLEESEKQRSIVLLIRGKLLNFKLSELTTEVFLQLIAETIMWVMILLISTDTKTVSGFEIIFQDSKSTWGLVASALFSLTTVMTTYLRIRCMEKDDFILAKGKVVLAIRSLVAVTVKVACVVMYFTPFMGLFSILGHLKVENMAPFEIPEEIDWESKFPYADTNLKFSDIYRFTKTEEGFGEKLPYSTYTVLKLKDAYIAFFILIFLNFLIHWITKLFVRKLNFANKDLWKSAFTSLFIPTPFEDWDSASTPSKQLRKTTLLELGVGIFVNWVFNILFLVPLFCTGANIAHRHSILREARIGLKTGEIYSYEISNMLMVVTPILVTIGSLLECGLAAIFHMFLHPWVSLLNEEGANRKEEIILKNNWDTRLEDIDENVKSEESPKSLKSKLEILENKVSAMQAKINGQDEKIRNLEIKLESNTAS